MYIYCLVVVLTVSKRSKGCIYLIYEQKKLYSTIAIMNYCCKVTRRPIQVKYQVKIKINASESHQRFLTFKARTYKVGHYDGIDKFYCKVVIGSIKSECIRAIILYITVVLKYLLKQYAAGEIWVG